MDTFQLIILLLDATLRTSTPLILAALAGMFSERSGTINLALEGMMLGGAFSAAAVAFYVGSPWVGLLAAIATTIAILQLFRYLSRTLLSLSATKKQINRNIGSARIT